MSMHIHILGICGTFMGGVAALAQAAGYRVTGSDQNVYPPMSDALASLGVTIHQGYSVDQFTPRPDLVIIGNALSRGNPAVEFVLNEKLPYVSGPQWLGEHFLQSRQVIAVAGTHGKTTTTAMLAWILKHAGHDPGYLIGGKAANFDTTANAGTGPFVIEADEYDTAFFDKRAKFVHYHPDICILNNLEFDHADIYPNIDAIKNQFHHLVRTIPGIGQLIVNSHDENLNEVLKRGVWSQVSQFGKQPADWQYQLLANDGSHFEVFHKDQNLGALHWQHTGIHNVTNALAAISAAYAVGVTPTESITALTQFKGVKRRMELLTQHKNILVYDDFAHHPTAIKTTLHGLRQSIGQQQLVVALELRSNSMRAGHHRDLIAQALNDADIVALKTPADLDWSPDTILDELNVPCKHFTDRQTLLKWLLKSVQGPTHIVFMSNGGFDAAPSVFVEMITRSDHNI